MKYVNLVAWLVAGIILDIIIAYFSNKHRVRPGIGKLRIHNTVHGIIFILIGLFIYTEFFVGLGLGLIIGHTARLKKLVFIEKMRLR